MCFMSEFIISLAEHTSPENASDLLGPLIDISFFFHLCTYFCNVSHK
jgi:hypothetical protein